MNHLPPIEIPVDLTVCSAQERAFRALKPGNTVCLAFGRGIGKSFLVRLFWYLLVAEWDRKTKPGATDRGIRIVLLMPTLTQAKKVHATQMLAELAHGGRWGCLGGVVNKTDWRVSFPGGSWIQWVSAENANDNRGIRCDAVFADECDDIDPEVIESITQPWFTEPFSLRITVLGGTPRRGRYGLLYRAYKQWPSADWWEATGTPREKAVALASRHFGLHATAYDAPRIVDPVYVDSIRAKTSPEIFAREYLCDFDSAEGLVYPMFDDEFHVREPSPDQVWSEMLVGADHGYEDPGVILTIGVIGSGRDAICWVLDEVVARHKDPSWWREKVSERVGWYPRARWYADPSRPDIINSWRTTGARMQDVNNAIEDGVAAVADRLVVRTREDGSRHSRIFVHPSCKFLIEEFGKYRRKRDPRNKERILDDIEDRNNHTMDALRYPLFGRFPEVSSRRNRSTFEDRAS